MICSLCQQPIAAEFCTVERRGQLTAQAHIGCALALIPVANPPQSKPSAVDAALDEAV